jgi:hypothetical protein
LGSDALVNVGLLTDTDFGDDVFEDTALDESLEGEVIVAEVSEFVAVV